MDGDGSAEDMWERLAHHMLSELRDEIRQGFANSSANIVEEIKQLLSTGRLAPYSNEEISNVNLQTRGIDSREPKYQVADEQATVGKISEENRGPPVRFRRPSSSGDLSRHVDQVTKALSESESFMNKSFGQVIDDAVLAARERYAEDKLHHQKFLYHLASSKIFRTFCLLMILANAAWMGYETDHRTAVGSGQLRRVGLTFNIWFTFEIILKIVAFQREFFVGPDNLWNLLDLFLVLCTIPEYFSSNSGLRVSIIRIVRLARLAKAFRVVRVFKYLSSLREMLMSLFSTLASLFWSFVAILLVTYVWSLLFMQSLGLHLDQGVQFSNEEYFKTVRHTMMTMYGCLTGGMDWYPFVMDFDQHGAYFAEYSLLTYIFFMMFGFLNVVIGVFCAKANEASNYSQEMRTDKEQEKQIQLVNDLVQIFNKIDIQRRGFIEKTQFLIFAANTEAQRMLQSHGLPTFAFEKMWRIMDEYDGKADDRVTLVSFIMGFMRLSPSSIATEVMLVSLTAMEMRSDIKEIVDRTIQLEGLPHHYASRKKLRMSKDAPHPIQSHERSLAYL